MNTTMPSSGLRFHFLAESEWNQFLFHTIRARDGLHLLFPGDPTSFNREGMIDPNGEHNDLCYGAIRVKKGHADLTDMRLREESVGDYMTHGDLCSVTFLDHPEQFRNKITKAVRADQLLEIIDLMEELTS